MLSEVKLSDLFFGWRHDNFDQLFTGDRKDPPSRAAMAAAVMVDAAEFAETYPEFGKDAEWYAKDFMERV